jgi:hypothetical protein
MAEPVRPLSAVPPASIEHRYESPAVRQAYTLSHVGFTIAPILAGLDKFFHFLTDWNQYLAPQAQGILGNSSNAFMLLVGAIEVIVGIGVALKPRIFAYILSAWLVGIIVNLLLTGQYFDIALRDLGLSIGAFALGRLSSVYDRRAA